MAEDFFDLSKEDQREALEYGCAANANMNREQMGHSSAPKG